MTDTTVNIKQTDPTQTTPTATSELQITEDAKERTKETKEEEGNEEKKVEGEEDMWEGARGRVFNHKVNLKVDLTKVREFKIVKKRDGSSSFPSSYDMQTKVRNFPAVKDQGPLGACVTHAGAVAMEVSLAKKNPSIPTEQIPRSPLFMYTNALIDENGGKIPGDIGLTLTGFWNSVRKTSGCEERSWPYVDVLNRYKIRPSTEAVTNAQKYKCSTFFTLARNLDQTKAALNQNFVVIFGAEVYSSFRSNTVAQTGIIPYPDTTKEIYLGGHCMAVIGYDDSRSSLLVQNSWGSSWANSGKCWFPYRYYLDGNLCGDYSGTDSFDLIPTSPAPAPAPAPAPTPTPAPVPTVQWSSILVEIRKLSKSNAYFLFETTIWLGPSYSKQVFRASWNGYVKFQGSEKAKRMAFPLNLGSDLQNQLQQLGGRVMVQAIYPSETVVVYVAVA